MGVMIVCNKVNHAFGNNCCFHKNLHKDISAYWSGQYSLWDGVVHLPLQARSSIVSPPLRKSSTCCTGLGVTLSGAVGGDLAGEHATLASEGLLVSWLIEIASLQKLWQPQTVTAGCARTIVELLGWDRASVLLSVIGDGVAFYHPIFREKAGELFRLSLVCRCVAVGFSEYLGRVSFVWGTKKCQQ